MIPQGSTLQTVGGIDVEEQPSRTYRLDLDKGRINGMIDDLDAVRQAVFKILQTERFYHLIYTTNFGGELNGVIGSNSYLIQSELSRRIREALIQDDRITDVNEFEFTFQGDEVLVQFTVVSSYGSFQAEVMQGV